MRTTLALARVLIVALGLALIAPPADAAPRVRKPGPTAKATTKAKPRAIRPTRASTRGRTPARPTRPTRTMAAAKVMVGGSLRPPSEPTGRAPARLTREEAAAEAIEKILRGPLRYGTTGLYVVDAQSGRELFAVNPDDPLNPASNVKLISTATALDLLGPGFRYTTRVLGPTVTTDGAVPGDVYLLGSYDPTLTRSGLDELAGHLAASGVRRIDGDVVVSGSSSRDGLWRSRVGVEVVAGAPGEAPAIRVVPDYGFVEVVSTATTGKRARVKGPGIKVTSALVTKDDGTTRLQLTVTGTVGKGKTVSRWLSTERHLHAAHLLKAALGRAGVAVTGDVQVAELPAYVDALATGGHLPVALAEHQSAPLAQIVAQINKRSINWLSDRVVATAAALTRQKTPSMSDGLDAMYGWLERAAGVARGSIKVDTGSGLSYRTEFSPRQIVQVVRSATGLATHEASDPTWITACAEAFRASLAVGGVDGTLRGRFRKGDLRGRVHGKTGTLSSVIALSGLLDGPGGRTLAFALVTNGHTPSRKLAVRGAHEQILQVLDDYLAGVAADAPPEADAAAEALVEAAPEMPTVGDGLDDEDPDASPSEAPEGGDGDAPAPSE